MLTGRFKNARVVPAQSPRATIDMLNNGALDVYAA
jgi:hypothetical protein